MAKTNNPLAPSIAVHLGVGPNLLTAFDPPKNVTTVSAFMDLMADDKFVKFLEVLEPTEAPLSSDKFEEDMIALINKLKRALARPDKHPILIQNAYELGRTSVPNGLNFLSPRVAELTVLIISLHEAGLIPDAIGPLPEDGFGLMQVIKPNQIFASKLVGSKTAKPLVDQLAPYFAVLGRSEISALIHGPWPVRLKDADLHWQILYNLYNWRVNLATLPRYIQYTPSQGWKPTDKLTNLVTRQWMSKHHDWFEDHDLGLAIMMIYGWQGLGHIFTRSEPIPYPPDDDNMKSRFYEFATLYPDVDTLTTPVLLHAIQPQ